MRNVFRDYALLTAQLIYDVNFTFYNYTAGFSWSWS